MSTDERIAYGTTLIRLGRAWGLNISKRSRKFDMDWVENLVCRNVINQISDETPATFMHWQEAITERIQDHLRQAMRKAKMWGRDDDMRMLQQQVRVIRGY